LDAVMSRTPATTWRCATSSGARPPWSCPHQGVGCTTTDPRPAFDGGCHHRPGLPQGSGDLPTHTAGRTPARDRHASHLQSGLRADSASRPRCRGHNHRGTSRSRAPMLARGGGHHRCGVSGSPGPAVVISAVGFDLAGTLMDYSAFRSVGSASIQPPSPPWRRFGAQDRRRSNSPGHGGAAEFNSRSHPRDREVDHLVVFGRLLEAMDAPPSNRLDLVEQAVDAFFAVFRRWVAAIPGADAIIAGLRRAGMPFGVLTDVPYGSLRRVLLSHVEAAGLAVPQSTLLRRGGRWHPQARIRKASAASRRR